jgi:polyferredoxin
MPVISTAPPTPRKKLLKRAAPDRSQLLRHGFQLAFLALNVWIATEFYLFVRYYERGGAGPHVGRPPGVEGWLPIASLMNLKVLLLSGEVPALHPAGLFIFLAFLAMSWIFRKSFCGWLCPIGTISEYLWRLGRQTFGRNFHLSRKLDIALRSLKYLLLALFCYAVGSMSVPAIRGFLQSPYGIVDDVKMLNFFRFMGVTGAIVMAVRVVASVFVQNFWCRYLCPYGALMGIAGLASPPRIRRDESLCIDCGKCTKACPSALPVARLVTIASAECTACLQCVASCPAEGALFMSVKRRRVPGWAIAAGVAALFLGFTTYARVTGSWHTNLAENLYYDLIPHATEFEHPR